MSESRGAVPGAGALPDTAAVVAQVAAETGRAAEQAAGLAEQLRSEVGTLLTRLGGGPPAQLVEAQALAEAAAGALGEASAALHDATSGLRAFAGRTT